MLSINKFAIFWTIGITVLALLFVLHGINQNQINLNFNSEQSESQHAEKEPSEEIVINGIILNYGINSENRYHLFTNDFDEFDTSTLGIRLYDIDDKENLHGQYVEIIGHIITKGERMISVTNITTLYSVIPSSSNKNNILISSIGDLLDNPDLYYNQTVILNGELYGNIEGMEIQRSVGCSNAKYRLDEGFVTTLSNYRLSNGIEHVGITINPDNMYISEKRLFALVGKQVNVTGLFVPTLYKNPLKCIPVINHSGYILTDIQKIQIIK